MFTWAGQLGETGKKRKEERERERKEKEEKKKRGGGGLLPTRLSNLQSVPRSSGVTDHLFSKKQPPPPLPLSIVVLVFSSLSRPRHLSMFPCYPSLFLLLQAWRADHNDDGCWLDC